MWCIRVELADSGLVEDSVGVEGFAGESSFVGLVVDEQSGAHVGERLVECAEGDEEALALGHRESCGVVVQMQQALDIIPPLDDLSVGVGGDGAVVLHFPIRGGEFGGKQGDELAVAQSEPGDVVRGEDERGRRVGERMERRGRRDVIESVHIRTDELLCLCD